MTKKDKKTDDELAEELSYLSYQDLRRLQAEIESGKDKYEAIDEALLKRRKLNERVETLRKQKEMMESADIIKIKIPEPSMEEIKRTLWRWSDSVYSSIKEADNKEGDIEEKRIVFEQVRKIILED